MANPDPDIYTVHVGAKPVRGRGRRRDLAGALTIAVTRTPKDGKSIRVRNPANLVMRPGDSLQFELGDIPFPKKDPRMRIDWKWLTGKEWPDAPTVAGKPGRLPPDAGFACQLFRYCISVSLGVDAKLPVQEVDAEGHTVITIDPDIGSDEC